MTEKLSHTSKPDPVPENTQNEEKKRAKKTEISTIVHNDRTYLRYKSFAKNVLKFESDSDLHAYQLKSIGSGAFATGIFPVYSKSRRAVLAVKVSRVPKSSEKRTFPDDQLQREYRITRKLKHPNIRSALHHVCVGKLFSFLPLEFVHGSELFTLMDEEWESHMDGLRCDKSPEAMQSITARRHIARGILKGLEFLHNRSIVHNDVKPENVLVGAKKMLEVNAATPVKLCDFGFSFVMDKEPPRFSGSQFYLCPDKLTQDVGLTCATDVFSFGVLMFALASNLLPFTPDMERRNGNIQLKTMVTMREKLKFSYQKWFCYREVRQVFLKATVLESARRPSASKLLRLSFFTSEPIQLSLDTF